MKPVHVTNYPATFFPQGDEPDVLVLGQIKKGQLFTLKIEGNEKIFKIVKVAPGILMLEEEK